MSELRLISLNLLTLVLLFVVGFWIIGFPIASQATSSNIFALPRNADAYIEISPDQLAAALDHKDFTLINVHRPYEGELPQTDIFIPYYQINDHLDKLPIDKTTPIVVYCRSGVMSGDVARVLASLGYTHVASVNGGMQAWLAANEPFVR